MMAKLPKYQQVYQQLRQRILSGSYPDGRLPSLLSLTKEYAVSLGTINRAVKQLESEALVNCQSGRGGTQINKVFLDREKELFASRHNPWQNIRFFLDSKVTLRFQTTPNAILEHEIFAALQAGFQRQYPWIDLKLQANDVGQGSEHEPENYDLCLLCSSELKHHIRSGAALDLSPCWQAFTYPPLSIPGYADLFGDTANYAVPVAFNTPLFYYNSTLLPAPPTSLEAFSKLTLDLQKKACFFSSILGLLSLLHYYIGNVPERIHLPRYRNQLAEALQFWKCCYYLPTDWNNFEPGECCQAFGEGKAAFLLSYYLNAGQRAKKKIDWQVARMPGQQAALLIIVLCIVSSRSRHPKEAWLFARYLLSKEAQDLLCRRFHAPPALEESFQGAFRENSPAEFSALQKIRKQMELDKVGVFSKSAVYQQSHNWLKAYFQQQCSLDEMVERMQSNLAQFFQLERIFDS